MLLSFFFQSFLLRVCVTRVLLFEFFEFFLSFRLERVDFLRCFASGFFQLLRPIFPGFLHDSGRLLLRIQQGLNTL